jgi:hypothetical protein
VNLYIDWNDTRFEEEMIQFFLLRVLTKIAPLITSIDTMHSLGLDLLKMAYNNNTNDDDGNESQLLLKEMMAQTRILVTSWLDWSNLFINEFFN